MGRARVAGNHPAMYTCLMHSPPVSAVQLAADDVPVLIARGLVRKFGIRRAVNDVSLSLAAGECLALFGPNGAGKTSLLRMLGGLLKPDEGSAILYSHALPGNAEVRRLVGIISHNTMLYASLTAMENLIFAAECYGIRDARGAARRALERLKVADRGDSPVRMLSRGLQQRVSIARALVHNPRMLLLDEPYTGLDDVGARALTSALKELKSDGAAMVLVTHHLVEGLELSTHAAIMLGGRLISFERTDTEGFDSAGYGERYRLLTDTVAA